MTGNWSIHNKQLLKGAYGEHLPKEILNRAKTGWRFPTDELLIGRFNQRATDTRLREWVREILSDKEMQDIFEYNSDDIENRYLQRDGCCLDFVCFYWRCGGNWDHLHLNPKMLPMQVTSAP